MECPGVYSAHACHLCLFVGRYLTLEAYETPLIQIVYCIKEIFCLNPSIIADLRFEDLSQEFFIENLSINVEFVNNKTEEITAGSYLVSVTGIVSDCQQLGTGALLIINDHILGILWGNQCFFLYDSHSKDEIGRILATGTAVLLKFI